MSDERAQQLSPEEVRQVVQERKNAERVKMWRARQRFVGSSVLGVFALYKLLTAPGVVPPDTGVFGLGVTSAEVFWIVVLLFGAGLATFDQALKALGKG